MIKIQPREYEISDISDDSSLSPIILPNKRKNTQKYSPAQAHIKSRNPYGKPTKRRKHNKNNSKELVRTESKENMEYFENEGDLKTPDFKVNHKKTQRDERVRRNEFPDILINEFRFLDSPCSSLLNHSNSK